MKEALKLALGYVERNCPALVFKEIKEALAQPVQEPVASYLPEMSIPNFTARVAWGAPDHIDLRNGWRPLYTTPAQRPWVGLTDEEISVLSKGHMTRNGFARNVLAKSKEKNT